MKKKILLLALAICHMGIALAQDKKVKVTGDVTDYETTEPIIAATIQLLSMPDSTFLSGATTDLKGLFELESRLPKGNYAVKVSFVGYGDEFRNFMVTEDTRRVRLDSIRLKTDALLLKEAVIEAQMAQVQVSEDTVIFNAETFRVAEGSMLEELIRKLPGYEVESDGTVKYNGKTVSKILVDGKEFFSEDKSIAMKNLPANMVKKVKSYEKKSDLAEITGIDDGEEELVLDLTVKENAKKGWFSNIDLGYGRPTQKTAYDIHNLYTVKGMVNRFKENEHYSVILSTNNVNDRGFGRGGRGGNGMTQSSMGGFSLAKNLGEEVEKNKYQFQIGGGLRFFHNDSDVQSQTASETFLEKGSRNSFSNSRSQSNNESLRVNADLRLEWRPDTMTDIIFRPSVSHSKSNNASNNLSATFDQDPYETILDKYADEGYEPLDSAWTDDSRINYNSRQSAGGNESTSVNGRLQINRKFNSKGRNLTLTLNGGYSTSESHSNSTSFTRFYRNDSTSTINRYNTTPSKTYNYNTRIMWSEPLWTATFLQLSYQFSYRYNNSDRSTYNLPDVLDNWSLPEWILPDDYERYRSEELSRFATYENMDHDITAQLRLIRDKYNMNVGITLLPQHSKMNYQYMGYDIDTVRTVFNFTPTMNFRYRWSKQTSLRINYRGRSSQPSMTDLLPITDDSDPLNITKGNPGLKPTFNNSLSPPEEVNTDVDVAALGTIFHKSAELAYDKLTERGNTIIREDIETLLKESHHIEEFVDEAFRTEFFHSEPNVPLKYNGTQLIVRHVICSYLRQLLTIDKRRTPFKYIESEKKIREVYPINSHGTQLNVLLGGTIDRIDSKQDESGREVTRILDYKTGGSQKKIKSIDELFQRDKPRDGYVFQAFYYSYLMSREYRCITPSLLFMRNTSDEAFEPHILIDQHAVEDFSVYYDQFEQLLRETIEEIFNSDIPYTATTNADACKYCKFTALCGKG